MKRWFGATSTPAKGTPGQSQPASGTQTPNKTYDDHPTAGLGSFELRDTLSSESADTVGPLGAYGSATASKRSSLTSKLSVQDKLNVNGKDDATNGNSKPDTKKSPVQPLRMFQNALNERAEQRTEKQLTVFAATGDETIDTYWKNSLALRSEAEDVKQTLRDYVTAVCIFGQRTSGLTNHVDLICNSSQQWPTSLKTYRAIHRHMLDTSSTLFGQLYEEVEDVLNQWLDESKTFLRELKRTNDVRTRRDESKLSVDSLFEEKVEGRKEWTEQQEMALQKAKLQLGNECTVYDGMLAGLKSHYEELSVNRMRCMDVVFEHLLTQEFSLFRPLLKAIRSVEGSGGGGGMFTDSAMVSPLPGGMGMGMASNPMSPLSPSTRFSSNNHLLLRSRMLSTGGGSHGSHGFSNTRGSIGGIDDFFNRQNQSRGGSQDMALFETVKQLQSEIVRREEQDKEMARLRAEIAELQSAGSPNHATQLQIEELKTKLQQQQSQVSSTIPEESNSSDQDSQIIVGSSAPPPPGADSSSIVVGSNAPPPPGMGAPPPPPPPPGAPMAPPMAPPGPPGAPPPPGPPPSFTFGTGGLTGFKPGQAPVLHRPLTAREVEKQQAEQYGLPLMPAINPTEGVLLKKIHWTTVPAAEIKGSVWEDVIMPDKDSESEQLISAFKPAEQRSEEEKTASSDDISQYDWSWQLDTSEFEMTFAQKAAVAMKRRQPKGGKKYQIRRRDGNSAAKDGAATTDDGGHSNESSDLRPALDDSDLEYDSNDDHADDGSATPRQRSGVPKALPKVELLDAKRSYNVSISLSRFKMSYEQLRDAVMQFDNSLLSLEMIDVLCEIMPSADEMKLVKSYDGPIDRLGDVERFFLTLAVPGLSARLKSFVFLLSFSQLASSIEDALDVVSTAYQNIQTSPEIRSLLGLLLRLGNYLNAQNKLPQVYGFHLSTLSKIRGVKSLDNHSTLLHYTVQYIQQHTASTRHFVDQLEPCRRAQRVESAFLQAEVRQLAQNVKLLNQLVEEDKRQQQRHAESKSPSDSYTPLPDKVYEFHKYSTARTLTITQRMSDIQSGYTKLAGQFLVPDMPWEEFFALWTTFGDEYVAAEQDMQIIKEIEDRKVKQAQALELIKERQRDKTQQRQLSAATSQLTMDSDLKTPAAKHRTVSSVSITSPNQLQASAQSPNQAQQPPADASALPQTILSPSSSRSTSPAISRRPSRDDVAALRRESLTSPPPAAPRRASLPSSIHVNGLNAQSTSPNATTTPNGIDGMKHHLQHVNSISSVISEDEGVYRPDTLDTPRSPPLTTSTHNRHSSTPPNAS